MANVTGTSSGGDTLRILDFDTNRPRLQVEGGWAWSDISPKAYPNALFAMAVALLRVVSDAPLDAALVDSGILIEED